MKCQGEKRAAKLESSLKFTSSVIWRCPLEHTVRIVHAFEVSKLSGKWQRKAFAVIFLNHPLPCAKHFKPSCDKSDKYQGAPSLLANSSQAPYEPSIVNEQTLDYCCLRIQSIHCNESLFSMHSRVTLGNICLLNIWSYYYWYGYNLLPANSSLKGHKVQKTLRKNYEDRWRKREE